MYLQLGIPSRCICFHYSLCSLSSLSLPFLQTNFSLSLSLFHARGNLSIYPSAIYALISDVVEVKGIFPDAMTPQGTFIVSSSLLYMYIYIRTNWRKIRERQVRFRPWGRNFLALPRTTRGEEKSTLCLFLKGINK